MKGRLRQRGPTTWGIIIELGRDAQGKRLQANTTFHGGKRAAQAELNRLIHEHSTGLRGNPEKLTLAQYLERWLQDGAKPTVKPRTYRWYVDLVGKQLIPKLGHHRLTELRALHIQRYLTEALETGRCDGRGGLSARTVLHHYRVLYTALEQAVRWQLLVRNPAEGVNPPRPRETPRTPLTREQAQTLLKAAEGTWLYLPLLLALGTGMRRGEILALRWSDIRFSPDGQRATARVERSLSWGPDGPEFGSTKTDNPHPVALPRFVVDALRVAQTEQQQRRLTLGMLYHDQGLVCPCEDGTPRYPDTVSKAYVKLRDRLGLPPLSFHQLRHAHATFLLELGVPMKVVSERLGHSNIQVTMDTYTHVSAPLQEDAADRMDALFGDPKHRPLLRDGAIRIEGGAAGT